MPPPLHRFRTSLLATVTTLSSLSICIIRTHKVNAFFVSSYQRIRQPPAVVVRNNNNNNNVFCSSSPVSTLPSNHRLFSSRQSSIPRSRNTSIHTLFSSYSGSVLETPPMNKQQRTINILCLHGKGGNGPGFQTILEPLWDRFRYSIQETSNKRRNNNVPTENVSIHVDYLTAPFPIPNNNDDQSENDATQWWTLPPHTRSFNAPCYEGFDTSANLLQNTLRTKPYDLVLGHSQGSILLAALMATRPSEWWSPVYSSPVGCVLNGCAWPNPFTEEINASTAQTDDDEDDGRGGEGGRIGNLLFVIGQNDKINPPKEAIRVRDWFERVGVKVDTCEHEGGHSVPVRDTVVVREVCDWMVMLMDV